MKNIKWSKIVSWTLLQTFFSYTFVKIMWGLWLTSIL